MWEKTPLGRKALQTAEERAEKFLEKNKYGLYRGEVLLDIGTAHLVSNFDIEKGEQWLNRAAEWFDSARQFDKDLQEFELPEQVRRVSTPPKNERFKDQWDNVRLSQPKPGDLFNRRTSSWYWNSKRKDVTLLQGLVAFAKEDYETAEKHWNLLGELDKEFYAQQKSAGWGNATTLARLTWNLKNHRGALYATPEEMASFKDPKRRLAVLIADLFYESEQPQRALSVYRRLELHELGTLSKNEKAYIILGIFDCLCWDSKIDELAYVEPQLSLFNGTPSLHRICLGFANRAVSRNDPQTLMKALRVYQIHLEYSPTGSDKEFSQMQIGMVYRQLAELAFQQNDSANGKEFYRKSVQHFQHCLKQGFCPIYETTIKEQLREMANLAVLP